MDEENKSEKNKINSKVFAYIAGGAVIGGIAGYIISKVGIKKITDFLKEKEFIPKNISKIMEDLDFKSFTSKKTDKKENDLNDLKDIMDE